MLGFGTCETWKEAGNLAETASDKEIGGRLTPLDVPRLHSALFRCACSGLDVWMHPLISHPGQRFSGVNSRSSWGRASYWMPATAGDRLLLINGDIMTSGRVADQQRKAGRELGHLRARRNIRCDRRCCQSPAWPCLPRCPATT